MARMNPRRRKVAKARAEVISVIVAHNVAHMGELKAEQRVRGAQRLTTSNETKWASKVGVPTLKAHRWSNEDNKGKAGKIIGGKVARKDVHKAHSLDGFTEKKVEKLLNKG